MNIPFTFFGLDIFLFSHSLPTRDVFFATHLVSLSFLNRLPACYVIHREKPAQIHPYLISLCANKYIWIKHIHEKASAGKLCYATNFYALRLSAKKGMGKKRLPTDKNDFRWWGGKTLKMLFWVFPFLSFRCHEGMISWKQRFTVKNFHFFSLRFGEKAVWKVMGEALCM